MEAGAVAIPEGLLRDPVGRGSEPHECAGAFVNISGRTLRRGGIIFTDMSDDCGEVVSGFRRPANLHRRPANFHLRTEHPFDTLAHFLVLEVFAPIELLQALIHLLAEPRVMIDVMLDQLLNILVRIAAVLSGHTVKLRLQLGAEMHFHALNLGL